MTPNHFSLVTVLTAVMALGACNKSDSARSPLSPSPLPAVPGAAGATISGVVSFEGASTAGMTVSVAGTTLVAPVDSSGRFSLTAVPSGDIELRFSGGAVDTSLAIAGVTDQDQIQLAVTVDSAASAVTSSQLTSSDRIEVKGVIASLSGACPDLTFTVNGFQAVTNASTRFEDAPCSGVQVGTKVEVKGTRQANGNILAQKVDVDGVGPDGRPEVRVDGTVSGLGGACPDRTFTVAGTAIVTNSATRFEDGTCATLLAGTRVQVKGTRQPNGSVLASHVDIDNPNPDPEVKVEGPLSNLGGACPDRTFTVAGTAIVTNSATRFEDGTCATLQAGTPVQVKGTRQPNGSVLATSVDIDNPNPEVKVEGPLSGLGGACPDRTFTVAGTAIVTNSATRFEDGTCATLQAGTPVQVKGTRQPNGSVLATSVDIDNPNPEVKVEGPLSGLGGACPDRTFTVAGTAIVTNSATRFEDGTCATLQAGTLVQVKGTRQPNGSVLATSVDIDNPDPDVKVEGIVSARSGACPALSFNINGTTVVTNNATQFEDGLCTTIQNGTRVDVKGTQQPNGTVLAAKIDIDNPDPDVKVEGIVSGRSGACPTVSFSVGGTTVVTDAATRFDDGSCSTLQNGTWVEVKGTRQPNGTVLAAKIDIDNSAPEVELKGTVSGLGGACPSLTFTVSGSAAVTNSATRYEDGSCSSLRNGTRVEVKGPRQPNGSVLATKVDIDN